MTAESKRPWSVWVRYGICIAAVTWLVTHTEWAKLREVWLTADTRLLLAGILAFGPAPLLIAIRLKWLLAVHDIHLSAWQAIKVTFAGNFVINALPVGTTGGDSVKAYYIARDTPYKHEAVTTVFFDRVIGVLGLVLLSGIAVLANWKNPSFAGWGRIIGVLVVLLMVGSGIYFSRRMRHLFRIDQIVARLPLASHFQRIDRAVFAFRGSYRRVVACLGLSILLQVIAIISLFLAGWALGMVGDQPIKSAAVYLGYTPICLLTGVLPIGVMEETFNQLLVKTAGLGTREGAYSLSLFGRVIQLVWALPGGFLVLRGQSFLKAKESLKDPETGVPATSNTSP